MFPQTQHLFKKTKCSVGTVTQHLQRAGQEPVVQRGVPSTPSIRTLGQRAKDSESYGGIGTGSSGTEIPGRQQGTKDMKFAVLKTHHPNAAVTLQSYTRFNKDTNGGGHNWTSGGLCVNTMVGR